MSEIVIEYEPREAFIPFHARSERWSCIVFHRRGGKTVACVNDLHTRALYTTKKNARYAYIAPFYRQAKEVAWQYLKDATKETHAKIRESDLSVELFNGAKITLYGADNPDALRGIYLDGVILDEYGDCRPSLWGEVILPTLADRTGWATFIGTPKGKNHFFEIREMASTRPDWFYLEVRASESGILPEKELKAMKDIMSPEQYQQELECSFTAAVKGTYYSSLIEELEKAGKINPNVTHDPDQEVYVAQDLGRTDSTALWFWQTGVSGPMFIDYEERSGKDLDVYFTLLHSKPYEYRTIWLPHDAVAKTLATRRSTIEQYIDAGFPCKKVPRLAIQHGVDAARLILKSCHINSVTCKDGVEALRNYRRQYNEVTKTFTDDPKHDWSSHGSDSFRYAALVCKGQLKLSTATDILERQGHYQYTLDQLFEDHERHSKPRFNTMRIA
jgi:hypothetical protein